LKLNVDANNLLLLDALVGAHTGRIDAYWQVTRKHKEIT